LSFQIAIDIDQFFVLKNQNGKIALSRFHISSGFFHEIDDSMRFCSSSCIQHAIIGIFTKSHFQVSSLLYNNDEIHKARLNQLNVSIIAVAFFIGFFSQLRDASHDSA
jgi:hypothetical protein